MLLDLVLPVLAQEGQGFLGGAKLNTSFLNGTLSGSKTPPRDLTVSL